MNITLPRYGITDVEVKTVDRTYVNQENVYTYDDNSEFMNFIVHQNKEI